MRVHPLVTVTELAAELADDPPVLLDVRWRLAEQSAYPNYLVGHLPGAVFVDLDVDLSGPPGLAGRHPLPDPAVLQRALRRWGVRQDGRVVVYDDGSFSAARAWWVLRWAGCGDVRVLDGGYPAWRSAGQAISAEQPPPASGDVVVRPGGLALLNAQGAAAVAGTGVLLDARAATRYTGESEPIDPVAGHIPGAISAPSSDVLTTSGCFRPAVDLRQHFTALGVDGALPVGAYCGSGVTAAGLVLALALAGLEASLYPGSWSEWITDPRRPVAMSGG